MSAEAHAIPDDILEAAKKSADALIARMCVTMDHSFGLQSDQEQRGLRTSMTQLAEHDIAPAIAKAIHDAVMAERERCAEICVARSKEHAASRHQWKDSDSVNLCLSDSIEALNCASAIRAAPKAEGK